MPVTRAATRAARLEAGGGVTAVLPNELLGAILCLAGIDAGAAVTLVCQRWRRVFYSRVCNRLWRSLTLTGSHASSNQDNWLAAKRSLLQRVAAWAEAVTMRPEARMSLVMRWVGARPAAQLLRLLHPATLRSLSLNYDCTTDVAQALRRLTGLTALRLPAGDGCKAVSEHLATALSSLPQLQSLSLTISVWDLSSNGAMLTACFPSQVTALELRCGPLRLEGFPHSRLPVLAHLCLSVSTLPPALVSDIAQLRALSHLELSSLDATLLTPAVLGPPACLPQLVSLQLKSGRPFLNGGLNLDAAADAADLLQQQLAAFPRLTQLSYDADGGLPLAGGARMRRWAYAKRGGPEAGAELDIEVEGEQPLGHLLARLLPPGMPLVQLKLRSRDLTTEAVQACSQLGALSALHWHLLSSTSRNCAAGAGGQSSTIMAIVGDLLRKAPRLAELTLHSCYNSGLLDSIPNCLAQYRGLRTLHLRRMGLQSAAAQGECWKGLRELDLSHNRLKLLPTPLMAATFLQALLLDHNPELQLREKDVNRTLARMPCLRLLSLRCTRRPSRAVRDLLRSRLPLLEVVV